MLIIPDRSIDPWEIINLKKILKIISALISIQLVGHLLMVAVGNRESLFITGFFGGLVSSTAMTMNLSKKSKKLGKQESINESVFFLSSTLAMLFESLLFIIIGTNSFNPNFLIILAGPILMTLILIGFWIKMSTHQSKKVGHDFQINLWTAIKLTLFIIVIFAVSKILQKSFGNNGLLLLTGIVSLFEVHGSIIANIQIYESNVIDYKTVGELISLSILCSYISKLAIIYVSANIHLKKTITYWTSFLLISVIISWILFNLTGK